MDFMSDGSVMEQGIRIGSSIPDYPPFIEEAIVSENIRRAAPLTPNQNRTVRISQSLPNRPPLRDINIIDVYTTIEIVDDFNNHKKKKAHPSSLKCFTLKVSDKDWECAVCNEEYATGERQRYIICQVCKNNTCAFCAMCIIMDEYPPCPMCRNKEWFY
jgi:hypothetical protein